MDDELKDTFGRRFSYLRLSIIDACNFRCTYCLPNGYQRPEGAESYLTLAEITNLVRAFAEMGTWKVRLTGGEPTLRRDLTEIARAISRVEGIRKVALSTNGYRLKHAAREYLEAGITSVNVSVDSLNPERFKSITGVGDLSEVLSGIDVALEAGFQSVKVNAVLMAGQNDVDFDDFLEWVRKKPVSVRFIELMPTGQNRETFARLHLKADVLRTRLLERGWTLKPRQTADGPAQEYTHPDYRGGIGLIAPYSKDFCSSCNRLRVTSRGGLRLCLFGTGEHSLRPLLQSESQKDELKAQVRRILLGKEVSHYLTEGKYGNNQTFSAMGG